MNNNILLNIQNLSKTYKGMEEPAVKDLSFHIFEKEIFGLLGPNGAGKTTTISIISSLLEPSNGDIVIDGHHLKNDLKKIKKIIGVAGQEIALYDKMTAAENLYYFGKLYGIPGKKLTAQIDYLLERLGLSTHRNKRVGVFSGGMKRRLNLMAAVLHKPKLLILDEPTVGIDVQSRNAIREFLLELNQNGTAMIFTSHMLEEVQKICARIAIIDQGEIIATGTPQQLIQANSGCQNLEEVFLKLTGHKLRD